MSFSWENNFGFEIMYVSVFGLDQWFICRLGAPLFQIRSINALIWCYHIMISCMCYRITDYVEFNFHILANTRKRTGHDSIVNALQMRPRYFKQSHFGLNEVGFNCLNAGYANLPVIPFNEISWHKGEQAILQSCQGRIMTSPSVDLCGLHHGCSLFEMCKLNKFVILRPSKRLRTCRLVMKRHRLPVMVRGKYFPKCCCSNLICVLNIKCLINTVDRQ